ncbi:MAG: glycosyltransferase [Bacteroidales bacterium]|nr:glycosyltransferase [Bacteroidales bacterium]NLM93681.1 glycosyltransferase family 4 protein [Bacteroidales bacterium]
MDVLYLSYDGMTDALGRSQVIPYLAGLSKKGHRIHVISCEKRDSYAQDREEVKAIFAENQIGWTPLKFSTFPPLLSKVFDLYKIRRAARRQHGRTPFEIVHCRSYIASFAGLFMKKRLGLKFVFDMRGFWVDERFEGNIWNSSRFFYRKVYKYFKEREKEFFEQADAVVSLTRSGKRIIGQTFGEQVEIRTWVIPCCTDLDLFSQQYITEERKETLRKQLNIEPAHFVLSYLGSIGTWYMTAEMMAFFRRLLRIYPDARFLFITGEDPRVIIGEATKAYVDPLNVIVVKAGRNEVPEYLSLSDISIFFIKPVFSKKASSPTKQAEIMSMGIPFITNNGIGDTDAILKETGVGIVIDEFTDKAYDEAIGQIAALLRKPQEAIRDCALTHFNLEMGVEQYDKIYGGLQ